jgi:hypothetical protein
MSKRRTRRRPRRRRSDARVPSSSKNHRGPAHSAGPRRFVYNFPALTGNENRQVTPAEWAFSEAGGEGFQSGFMLWFANHVPRVAGRHNDGVLLNWWEYALNFNDYAEALR